MKLTRQLFLFALVALVFSCEENEGAPAIEITQQLSFTVAVSNEDPSTYLFENTTEGKEDFYSYWEISGESGKIADNGVLEYTFGESGPRTITLTMVGTSSYKKSSQDFTVTLPPPDDVRFLINPENLLTNAYMTEGDGSDFTGWNKYNGGDRLSEETTDVLVGFRALKVVNPADGNPWETQFVSDAVQTNDGEEYTVSMWLKGDPVTVRFSTNPGVGGDQYAGNFNVTSDWTQYSYTFTANSATTLIALDIGASGGTFLVDAVEMVSGPNALGLPSNDSALLNGSFEVGEGADFTNWNKYNGTDRFSEETEDVLSGMRALKVVNPVDGNPWETQFVTDAFDTVNGQEYTVSLWIKGDAVTIRYSTNPGVGGDQYAGDYVASGDWTQYSWTFTANSDTTLIALDMGATAGSFIVDNVKVVAN